MMARTLVMGSRIGQPFFFLFAIFALGISAEAQPEQFGATLAILSFAYMGADTLSNLVWGYLSDRQGFRSTFVISTAMNIAGRCGTDALRTRWRRTRWPSSLIGAGQSGFQMSTTQHRARIRPPARRADAHGAVEYGGGGGGRAGAAGGRGAGAAVGVSGCRSGRPWSTMAAALVVLVWKVEEPRQAAAFIGHMGEMSYAPWD